jgi:exopolyphosphatase/guanosine-5'-triphosphate,3'-diphosphate pyrophosphatase
VTALPERERLGAIDVGSNSIRLLVAEYDPATGFEVIDEVKDQPRLGTGVAAKNTLDLAAMVRAFAALKRMKEVAERRGVTRLAAVATSAMRDARNGPAFAERVRRELGIPLEIIDENREAQLSWRSVAHHFNLENARTIVADIGGGSLELVGAVAGLVEVTTSLPLGAVRLTEQHLPGKRDSRREVEDLRRAVRPVLRKALAWRDWRQSLLIGSGGTFTNLGRMAAARRGHLGDAVHGTTVSTGEVEALLEWLSTKSPEERTRVPGLNPQRADIILAGLAVTAELLQLLDARDLTVSAFGLREGLLLEMIGAGQKTHVADPLRLMREFVDRCRGDRRHVEQVRLLALSLHEQLADALKCTGEERWLLESAALLHDVGQLVSYRKHHKHSFQLITHAERLGLGSRDRALVALISRYHRKRGPSRKDADFARLGERDQDIVRRVAALLRVADGLDRGHTAAVDRVTATLEKGRCVVRAWPRLKEADVSLEVWGAERKSDVLARLLKREVVVEAAMVTPAPRPRCRTTTSRVGRRRGARPA